MRKCVVLILLILLAAQSVAQADSVYVGFIYDAWSTGVPAPNSYLPAHVINGVAESGGNFRNLSDVYVYNDERVFLSDAGNNRIVVLDADLALVRVITQYIDAEGQNCKLANPAGLFMDREGLLYVCLPDEESVIVLDEEDRLVRTYCRPDTDLLDETAAFRPFKVIANQLGTVFVLPKGLYLGAVMYDAVGNFLGFYGANKVTPTLDVIIDYQWKQLLTQEQVNSMARYVPIQYASFDIDGENFVYTCTNDSTASREISKLNALGSNVMVNYVRNQTWQTGNYGDMARGYYMGQIQDSSFVDICVRDNGLFFVLDHTRGRIFEYDQESHLICVFGGPGYQEGTFLNAVSIDTLGERVLVLDADKGTVTVFEKTDYGALVEEAVLLYNDGLYEEARVLWEEIARRNINCELAYIGIGKALYEQGEYKEAMHYFKLGYDREGYSKAYEEYRKIVARQVMPYVLTVALAGGLLAIGYAKVCRAHGKKGGRV